MEKSENEVYLGSNSYCKVGKITAKKTFEEDQSVAATDLEQSNENTACILVNPLLH
jgi:autonomous glycyl radical cofactor GrcA